MQDGGGSFGGRSLEVPGCQFKLELLNMTYDMMSCFLACFGLWPTSNLTLTLINNQPHKKQHIRFNSTI